VLPELPGATGFDRLLDTRAPTLGAPRPVRSRRMVVAPRSVVVLEVRW
jgi:hypothetical protein